MREIKFRAWFKEEKYMGQVVQIHWPTRLKQQGEVHILVGELDTEKTYVGVGGHYYLPYSSIELMQYTGLKDKNGKEIYEGDVVRFFNKDENKATIEWSTADGAFSYIYLTPLTQKLGGLIGHVTPAGIQVIGNIYENPV